MWFSIISLFFVFETLIRVLIIQANYHLISDNLLILSFQVSTRTGIEHEETLLSESAARETSLNTQIIEFELENKQTKAELERLKNEKTGALSELTEVQKACEVYEHELKQIKSEVKEYRFRETRLLTDYSELEEENVALQKQVGAVNLFKSVTDSIVLGFKFENHNRRIWRS